MATVTIKLNIYGEISIDDLAKIAPLIRDFTPQPEPAAEAATEAPKPARTRTTKPKAEPDPAPEQEETPPEPDPDVNDTAEQADDEQEAGPTKADVEAALRKLVQANGRDAAAEALGKFNATNISTVKEKDYAKFIAHCEKAAK